MSSELISQQIQAVRDIEYLTVDQQQLKQNNFVDKFSKMLIAPVNGRIDSQNIKFYRFSHESEPVVQRLSEYIDLRR
jgi:hypothetical protein